ncbi:hypothetical protein I3843_Q025500 [Carya illinoinensis]|nr:hypothetical protein I3843_Q025500 [Carya illinoinensis]
MGLDRTTEFGTEPNLERKVSNTPTSLPASPMLDDLDRLVGQDLVNLATTFDLELPAQGSTLMGSPPFKFPYLLASTPGGGESNFEIFKAFSLVAGIVILGITPITTRGDQIYNSSTLPTTISRGITPSTDNK